MRKKPEVPQDKTPEKIIDPNTGREFKPVTGDMQSHLAARKLDTPCKCGDKSI